MTPKEYNAMPEGDNKLAVRLAITMGWCASLLYSATQNGDRVFVEDPDDGGWACTLFNPFTDPSIPFGLIGRGVIRVGQAEYSEKFYAVNGAKQHYFHESKTHAIIQAFCAADPLGHWARFMKGGE